MSTPTYFRSARMIDELERAAAGWLGTPFRNNSAVPGPRGGVSCHRLAAELYFATGALGRFAVPQSSAAQLASGPERFILEYIDAHLGQYFAIIDPAVEAPLPGDLIIMRENRVLKHTGVVLSGGRFVHVFPRLNCLISLLADSTYGERIEALRRPLP